MSLTAVTVQENPCILSFVSNQPCWPTLAGWKATGFGWGTLGGRVGVRWLGGWGLRTRKL
jgi:hypothetical protein